jgi:hypothetical protein
MEPHHLVGRRVRPQLDPQDLSFTAPDLLFVGRRKPRPLVPHLMVCRAEPNKSGEGHCFPDLHSWFRFLTILFARQFLSLDPRKVEFLLEPAVEFCPDPTPPQETLPLPGAPVLSRLALSDTGFVFDPVSGDSFTLNQTGLALLRIFLRHRGILQVLEEVERDFEVDPLEAERDIHDFAVQLAGSLKP